MKRIIISIVLSLSTTLAHAADVSADAGKCAAYKVVLKDKAAGQRALNAATNKKLAENHFLTFLKRMQEAGGDKAALRALASEGHAACDVVGVD